MCVVIPFIPDGRLVDAPAGVTQEEGDTGFLHLLSAVLAFVCIARRIQLFLYLVDHEVEVLSAHELVALHLLALLLLLIFVRKKSSLCDRTEIRTHFPTSEGFKVTN